MSTTTIEHASAVFTIRELSRHLQRSEPSLHRDLAAARLPRPIRIGKSLRFLKADVDEWLRQGCPSQAEFEARKRAAR